MKVYETFLVEKMNKDAQSYVDDFVISEYPLTVYINNEKYVTMLCTPKNLKELIVGYLKSENIIKDLPNIKEVKFEHNSNKVYVEIDKNLSFESNREKILVSGCAIGSKLHDNLDEFMIQSITSNYRLDIDKIFESSNLLNQESKLFKLTGGVHSCLLYDGLNYSFYEDIGRHNAIDKMIGDILINNKDVKRSFVFTSGRISSDILLKCLNIGIPVIISRSAPTSLSIELAKKYGVTIIGFVRGNKMNIYSNSFRIKKN